MAEVYGPIAPSKPEIASAVADRPAAIPVSLHQAASIAVDSYPAIAGAKAERKALESELRGTRWLSFPSLSVEALVIWN